MKISGITNFNVQNYAKRNVQSPSFKGVIVADPTGGNKEFVSLPTDTIDEYMVKEKGGKLTEVYIKTRTQSPENPKEHKFYSLSIASADSKFRNTASNVSLEIAKAFKDGAVFGPGNGMNIRIKRITPVNFTNVIKKEEEDAFKKDFGSKK